MKRSDFTTKIAIAVIFLAIASYFGFSIVNSLMNPFKSALAVNMTVSQGISATGMVVRDETVVKSGGKEAVNVVVSEGERVSAGGVVAGVYGSENTLANAREAEALDVKIQNLESAINTGTETANIKNLDTNINDGIYKLVIAARGRTLSNMPAISTKLQANILIKNSGGNNLQAELLSLRQQKAALGSAASYSKILAPTAGLFSSGLDGFESVTIDSLSSLNTASLKALLAEKRSPDPGALGKIVSGARWYYAALISADDAPRLTIGETASMVFGRYLGSVVDMSIESVGERQDGQCVVLFSSNNDLSDMLSVRMQSVQIICEEYSGVRVPKEALRLTSEGKSCVYTLSGVYAEQKQVKILYESEDYYIVQSADTKNLLRAGDQIITSTKDIYNGKIVK